MLPYYDAHIWPALKSGKRVLVAAHGNSLRALIMRLENLSSEAIIKQELGTGVPIVYDLTDGRWQHREPCRSLLI